MAEHITMICLLILLCVSVITGLSESIEDYERSDTYKVAIPIPIFEEHDSPVYTIPNILALLEFISKAINDEGVEQRRLLTKIIAISPNYVPPETECETIQPLTLASYYYFRINIKSILEDDQKLIQALEILENEPLFKKEVDAINVQDLQFNDYLIKRRGIINEMHATEIGNEKNSSDVETFTLDPIQTTLSLNPETLHHTKDSESKTDLESSVTEGFVENVKKVNLEDYAKSLTNRLSISESILSEVEKMKIKYREYFEQARRPKRSSVDSHDSPVSSEELSTFTSEVLSEEPMANKHPYSFISEREISDYVKYLINRLSISESILYVILKKSDKQAPRPKRSSVDSHDIPVSSEEFSTFTSEVLSEEPRANKHPYSYISEKEISDYIKSLTNRLSISESILSEVEKRKVKYRKYFEQARRPNRSSVDSHDIPVSSEEFSTFTSEVLYEEPMANKHPYYSFISERESSDLDDIYSPRYSKIPYKELETLEKIFETEDYKESGQTPLESNTKLETANAEKSDLKVSSRQRKHVHVAVFSSEHGRKQRPPSRLYLIPGTPGVQFPEHNSIPDTSFTCKNQTHIPGFYADKETGCQVFHVCWPGRRESFLCPLGTIFNQAILACDYWYNSNCSISHAYHDVNAAFKETDSTKAGTTGPMVDTLIKSSHTEVKPQVVSATKDVDELYEADVHFSETIAKHELSGIWRFLPVLAKVYIEPQPTEVLEYLAKLHHKHRRSEDDEEPESSNEKSRSEALKEKVESRLLRVLRNLVFPELADLR